jgi:hypothetical protein
LRIIFANGKRWWVRLHEKGGKRHEMPAHHKLEAFLDEYIRAPGRADRDLTQQERFDRIIFTSGM